VSRRPPPSAPRHAAVAVGVVGSPPAASGTAPPGPGGVCAPPPSRPLGWGGGGGGRPTRDTKLSHSALKVKETRGKEQGVREALCGSYRPLPRYAYVCDSQSPYNAPRSAQSCHLSRNQLLPCYETPRRAPLSTLKLGIASAREARMDVWSTLEGAPWGPEYGMARNKRGRHTPSAEERPP
jgi:hypothetical protein